jgi:two-component system sensor histidine kinase MprB
VAQTALAPVRKLTDATEHVTSTGDLSGRIEARGTDELSRLAGSFNTMLEALEKSLQTQRRLVADASHELRTPLTSLRTNIEVLGRAREMGEAERRRLLDDVVTQLEELTVLVGDLVELARGNEPVFEVDEVRLDSLVDAAVGRAQKRFPEVEFTVTLEPCVVRGLPERLDRAVGNLLDNAAKWSPHGGEVEVGVRDGEIWVRDHGPGIDADDLPYLFDRFYRASSARGMPGSGLGLAIVRQVAESHGGSVSVENAEGGGARFRLEVPTST